MGHIKKDHLKDYWYTDLFLETPIFWNSNELKHISTNVVIITFQQ
jgi:hypothetical protein